MKKHLVLALSIVLMIALLVAILYRDNIERASFAGTLFSGQEQYQNFGRLSDLFPHATMTAPPTPYEFPEQLDVSLPQSFSYQGQHIPVQKFLADTDTVALLVLRSGVLRFERYTLTGGRDVNWLSMSMAKSFVSAGIGIAVDEGLINIQDSISDYLPILQGSAYDGVRIKDVLQMSSGAAWDENYSDPDSDVNRLGRIMALGGSTEEFVGAIAREWEPGTRNRYNSADTQALGMLLVAATGKSITSYLTEKLWHPLGMESPAHWLTDNNAMEMAFFGLNATARDYAKFGELYRMQGKWAGKQLVSRDWVSASTVPDAPHLMPNVHEDFPLGYGYQWWIPESDYGEYAAIGVYNQFIYVNPAREMVIVKLSAFSDYAVSDDESSYREMETIEFFRELGRHFD